MKQGWEIKKLGEVCNVSAGQGAPQGDSNYCTNGTPFIKAGNLEDLINGFLETDIQNVSEEVAQKHRLKLYKTGSVVFAKSGMSCMKGYVYALQNDCYVVSHLAILTPHSINTFFLKYLLEFYRPNALVKDSAYPSISLEDIKSFPIPIPPLHEQEKIVAELDCLNGIIEKKKQQLKELDSLAQSIFYEMFGNPIDNEKGWEVKKFGEVANCELGKMLDTKKNQGDLYPYLCSINVQWNNVDCSQIKEMRIEQDELERYRVLKGDLLICEGGDTGRCAIWNSDDEIYYQNALHRVRFDNKIMLSIFCLFVMKTYKDNGEIDKYSTGQTIKHLVKKVLLNISLIVPPLFLQQEFASKIELIEKQKKLIKQSIDEVETLFNSRMDYYFS